MTMLGRPIEYDREKAIKNALDVFWRQGYEATSMTDLCRETGLSKSTLYAVFGDKRRMFLDAIQEYSNGLLDELRDRYRAAASPAAFLHDVLYSIAREAGPNSERRGCLVMNSATEFAQSDRDVARIVRRTLDQMTALFEDALVRGTRQGVARTKSSRVTAVFLVSTIAGMKTMVKAGRSQQELEALADMAMQHV
ncbi:MAG: TetR/AcrR family transcriptional regulator [bacterium]